MSRKPFVSTLTVAACAALILSAVALPVWADKTVRTIQKDLPAEDAKWFFIDLPIGELDVRGTDGDRVHLILKFKCENGSKSSCRDVADDIELDVDRRSDGMEVGLDHWPKFRNKGLSIEGHLELPRRMALEVELGVGEVHVTDMEDDVEINLGVGEVSVETDESVVRSVNLDAGVGEASLRVGGRTIEGSGFIGHGLDWRDGPGRAHIKVDCGVGSVDVFLE